MHNANPGAPIDCQFLSGRATRFALAANARLIVAGMSEPIDKLTDWRSLARGESSKELIDMGAPGRLDSPPNVFHRRCFSLRYHLQQRLLAQTKPQRLRIYFAVGL